MARAILVIDVQKVYTDPASPLHCVGNAEAIANINAITSAAEATGDDRFGSGAECRLLGEKTNKLPFRSRPAFGAADGMPALLAELLPCAPSPPRKEEPHA
ncbi:hypothetical protein [Mesorhizobium wenxiniae]|uniref:hypothetical protein n=1 Tax=Mesorhizobium wenxiniae TaxID=2014805 RepID=UPI00197D3509|nr:hypothetical protein [Mesorhizobium wenxiniae]